VEYDATLGFPKSVYIDVDASVADEEISYQLGDLEIF
jgi:hypothetical protein